MTTSISEATTGARTASPRGYTEQAARLRAEVALASTIVAPHWPIDSFIAVNPLGGLEGQPFGDALRRAGDVFGARGTLPESAYRDLHRAGRIDDRDLDAAIAAVLGDASGEPSGLGFGGRVLTPAELVRCDLLHGVPAPDPARTVLSRGEQRSARVADAVDAHVSKWCTGFFGADSTTWSMPGRAAGLYGAWRELAPHDRDLPTAARRGLRGLPERPEDAAITALAALGVSEGDWREYFVAHLSRLPGWSGHVRWRARAATGGDGLIDLLAMRLVLEAELLAAAGVSGAGRDHTPTPPPGIPDGAARASMIATAIGVRPTLQELTRAATVLERVPVRRRAMVWLAAYEHHYRADLLRMLSSSPSANTGAAPRTAATSTTLDATPGERDVTQERPSAQVICCIDTRSEGLRRHLEAAGPYETFGFAGFFAAAIEFRDLAGGRPDDLCPALISPRNSVRERGEPAHADRARKTIAGRRRIDGASNSLHSAERGGLAPFALAESAGWLAGPVAAAKTFSAAGYGRVRERIQRALAPPAPTTIDVESGFTAEERAQLAQVALRTIGLTSDFARVVVLCGHGSTTENNPYGAALDCGACGGNRGAANARTAAAILNRDDVRAAVAESGIQVPPDTWFVAAEHDTATDAVTLLDGHLAPSAHREELDALQQALDLASTRLAAERAPTLPGGLGPSSPAAAVRHVRARSSDWAQVYPEWGLARNAAMIIGPRAITRDLDLQRRVFLHSYEAGVDDAGEALETILTAPLVVAQWINCQYYFSTVDPEVFGAGTKTIHNAIPGVGVLAGHAGDLQTGLPWQSVAEGDRIVHEPMRLLAAVQAPLQRIEAIVARNSGLGNLVWNDWITLVARPHAEAPWEQLSPTGWKPWQATTQKDLGA